MNPLPVENAGQQPYPGTVKYKSSSTHTKESLTQANKKLFPTSSKQ
jgi:hypothetical protein